MDKIQRYDLPNDVSMRLGSTYLRYKGKCYFAEYVGGFDLQLHRQDEKKGYLVPGDVISANNPDLDISSAPLGYCNVQNYGPVYLSRPAERRQRQGVFLGNLSGFDEPNRQWRRPVSKYVAIEPHCIMKTIEGQYPILENILNEKNPKMGYAFHRRLALMPLARGKEMTWKLKYMSKFIGLLNVNAFGAPVANLIDDHAGNSFLRQTLNTYGVQISEYH